MRSWTVAEMMAEPPCRRYNAARVAKLWGGRESLTLVEILRRENIPPEDRVWVACRPSAMSDEQLRAWLHRTAERAVRRVLGRSECPQWEAWAAGWLSDEDRSRKAMIVASWAAWAVGSVWAAWATKAASSAAEWAADATMGWATMAAGDANDTRAERVQQVADLLEIVEG